MTAQPPHPESSATVPVTPVATSAWSPFRHKSFTVLWIATVVVSQLVPKQDLHPAIAANSAGVNVSRAVGPALGGVIVGSFGIAAPFWINAASNLGIIGALLWWREPQRSAK